MAEAPADRLQDALIDEFLRRHPEEAARAVERLAPAEIGRRLDAVSTIRGVGILERLTPEVAAQALGQVSDARAGRLLGRMDPGRAASVLLWLEPDVRERYLAQVPPLVARELRGLAEYPFDSAGYLMDPRVNQFRLETTVRDVLARLRVGRRRSIIDVFLIDDLGRLVGSVALREVAVAPLSARIGSLPRQLPQAVPVMATRAEIVERLADPRLASLPVVDLEERLLGVIRPETLRSLAQDDAGGDMQAMVGVSREERALSKVSFAVRKRLPWLHINLATAFLAAAVVGLFEHTIAQFTALAVLLPVVAGQSGNTGAQALAVVMRGLALREVSLRHWLRVALKESQVALINGVAVAVTTALGVLLWSGSPGLAGVIALAMVLSMVVAGLAGAIIPMLLTTAGQDPAQASSIILTTVTDVVGFLSFLGLATLMAGSL